MDRRLERIAKPEMFLKGYFPDRFYRPMSNDQLEAIATIVYCAKTGADEFIAAPRGDWKTETCKGLVIYLMFAGVCRFPVIFGSTTEDANKKFQDIKRSFEREELAADFPEICDPIIELGGTPAKAKKQTYLGESTRFEWTANACTLPHVSNVPSTGKPSPYGGCAFTYRGFDAQVRGINLYGARPDFPLCDDLETAESARSPYQIAIRTNILDKDVGGLAGGGETLPRVVVGTVQNDFCLTHVKLKEWGGKRYSAIKTWPEKMELWHEYIEIRRAEKAEGSKDYLKSHQFYLDRRDEMDAGSVANNPHRISQRKRSDGTPFEVSALQNVMNEWADKGESYVMTELQNDPPKSDPGDSIKLTAETVRNRISGKPMGELPPDVECFSIGLDVGQFECHWTAAGFVPGFTGWISEYGVLEVHPSGHRSDVEAAERSLYRALMSFRQQVMAMPRVPDVVAIDTGAFTNVIYQFIRDAGGEPFRAIKGTGNAKFQHGQPSATRIVGDHWFAGFLKSEGVWVCSLDSDYWKQFVHQMFITPTFDEAQQFNPGALSLYAPGKKANGEYDLRRHLAFSKHITAEEYRSEFIEGKGMQAKWFVNSRNNHWLDSTCYCCAGARIMGVSMDFNSATNHPNARQQITQQPKRPSVTGIDGGPFLATERK